MFGKVEAAGQAKSNRPAPQKRPAPLATLSSKQPVITQYTGAQTGCSVLQCALLCVAVPWPDTDVTHLAYDLQTCVQDTGSASGLLLLPEAWIAALPSHLLDEWAALRLGVMASTTPNPEAEARQLLTEHASETVANWQAYLAQLPAALR